jgi:neutral ceramidase
MRELLLIWLVVGWAACRKEEPPPDPPVAAPEPVPIALGAPSVGAAEGYLDLPVGTPLSGYTARCGCFGSFSKQDDRDSAYTHSFVESTGVQTWPTIKVIWVDNGDDHLVITKTDSIYSADGLVAALTARLEAETGEVLAGRVIHTANHSHSSFGGFAAGVTWYLGSDVYNEEVFQRMVDRIAAVALEAYEGRAPGRIGVGWGVDWDPADAVYRDRRGENDALQPWGPEGPPLRKDPHLGVVRFDDLDGEPLALMVNFGMHGIIGSERSPLASSDAGGHLETGLEQSYGDRKVVVMFTQGSGGDASPGGEQDDYAKMESVGVRGAPLVRAVADAIETSAEPVHLETVSRAVLKDHDSIRITRGGTVDWSYAPFDPDPAFLPDDVVYEPDGSLAMPIDEFNTENGAVFCGQGGIPLPDGTLPSQVEPYTRCLKVDAMATLLELFFDLAPEDVALPLPESLRAGTTATRFGPVPTRRADGSVVSQDLLIGFFPGEPVYSFGEQWRRRAAAELGLQDAMLVGYAQDHEGYLLIPEDWLLGGYEPDITVWGPLEAEHVMEGVLGYAGALLGTTDLREPVDPDGVFGPTEYPEVPLPTLRPDETPGAGTRITEARPYLWTPFLDLDDPEAPRAPTAAELAVPEEVPRVQGLVQLAWEGGDPGVDAPKVVLEREEGGAWAPVTTPAGRIVDEGRHDILLAHTPTPLGPADAAQTHQWWAGWQAVGHWEDRASLPLGRYRLRVTGRRYTGEAATWPWDTAPYEVVGEAFELVPAAITVTEVAGELFASLVAPAVGYRLVAPGGDEGGDNPVVGPVAVEVDGPDGTEAHEVEPELADGRSRLAVALPEGWTEVRVTDGAGNVGVLIAL